MGFMHDVALHVWARRLSVAVSETFGGLIECGRVKPPAGQMRKGQGYELMEEV